MKSKKYIIGVIAFLCVFSFCLREAFSLTIPQDGAVKSYYPNGALKEIVTYKKGRKEGIAQKFYDDGVLSQEAFFKADKPEGVGRIYFPNGQIDTENLYQDGVIVGVRMYDQDGNILTDTFPAGDYDVDVPQDMSFKDKIAYLLESEGESKEEIVAEILTLVGLPLLAVTVFVYLFFCAPLQIIAYKEGIAYGWIAYIPIAQIFLLFQLAEKPLWWLFASFVAIFIPIVNIAVLILINILLWAGIAQRRGKPAWIGILVAVPIIQFFIPWYLALTKHTEKIIQKKEEIKDSRAF